MEPPPRKIDMDFLTKDITNITSNYTSANKCFVSNEWCQGCWVWVDELPTLGPPETVVVLKLGVVFREA
jgi:hypothetical protein